MAQLPERSSCPDRARFESRIGTDRLHAPEHLQVRVELPAENRHVVVGVGARESDDAPSRRQELVPRLELARRSDPEVLELRLSREAEAKHSKRQKRTVEPREVGRVVLHLEAVEIGGPVAPASVRERVRDHRESPLLADPGDHLAPRTADRRHAALDLEPEQVSITRREFGADQHENPPAIRGDLQPGVLDARQRPGDVVVHVVGQHDEVESGLAGRLEHGFERGVAVV